MKGVACVYSSSRVIDLKPYTPPSRPRLPLLKPFASCFHAVQSVSKREESWKLIVWIFNVFERVKVCFESNNAYR